MFKSIHYFALAVVIFTSAFRIPNVHADIKLPPKTQKEALLEKYCSHVFFTKIVLDDIRSSLSKEGRYHPNFDELSRKLEATEIPLPLEGSIGLTLERLKEEQRRPLGTGLGAILMLGGLIGIGITMLNSDNPNLRGGVKWLYALATVLALGSGFFLLSREKHIYELDHDSAMNLYETLQEYKQTLEDFVLDNNGNC